MSTKRCNKCQQDLPYSKFSKRRPDAADGKWLLSKCMRCTHQSRLGRNDTTRRRYFRNNRIRMIRAKLKAIAYLGGRCMGTNCPLPPEFTPHPACFDFHHRDPDEKDFEWTTLKKWSWDRIVTELDKCDLLCVYCHRMRHVNLELHEAATQCPVSSAPSQSLASTSTPI